MACDAVCLVNVSFEGTTFPESPSRRSLSSLSCHVPRNHFGIFVLTLCSFCKLLVSVMQLLTRGCLGYARAWLVRDVILPPDGRAFFFKTELRRCATSVFVLLPLHVGILVSSKFTVIWGSPCYRPHQISN